MSPTFYQQEATATLGELSRFKGFWIVNGDRRSRRAVYQLVSNVIQTTTFEYRENFGCPTTRFRSIRMRYSSSSDTYKAKIKSTGKTIEEHRQAPWLKHEFTGVWDANAKVIIWTSKHNGEKLRFTTRFLGHDKHSIELFEMSGNQIVKKLAGCTFERLH